MAELPKDRLLALRERIKVQRNTVETLKRDGHEHVDADRQLRQMLAELERAGESSRPV